MLVHGLKSSGNATHCCCCCEVWSIVFPIFAQALELIRVPARYPRSTRLEPFETKHNMVPPSQVKSEYHRSQLNDLPVIKHFDEQLVRNLVVAFLHVSAGHYVAVQG
eukprot:1844373-Rhodomonas_salina.2